MMIFTRLLTATRRLFHQHLPVLSAASQVIKPCGSLPRLLITTAYDISALNRRIFGSLLVHLEQLVVVLAGSTRIYLQFFFIRGHSLTGEAALGV